MHPLLARYLNLDLTLDTLRRDERGEVLRAEEQPLARVARAHPDRRAALLGARAGTHPPEEVQQALVSLAAFTTAAALSEDAELAPAVARAKAALVEEGASDEEVEQLLGSLLLEEAFGYEDAVDRFDRGYFLETLDTVPELARLSRERVQALVDSFVSGAEERNHSARRVAAEVLLEAAWAEGPEPINPEHVEGALAEAWERTRKGAREPVGEALRQFLSVLHRAGLVGPLRLARLERAVAKAGVASARPH